MSDQNPEYSITIALIATAAYSFLTIALYATTMWIPGFVLPLAWLLGCIIGAPFFIYLIQATGKPTTLLPMMATGLGMTIAQAQAYSLLGYLAISQFLTLLTMTVATQIIFAIIKKTTAKKTNPKPFSPIIFTAFLIALAITGFTLGTALGTVTGQGPAHQISKEKLLQQLNSNDMQRRWDAFNYLATERPLLLTELTMSGNPKIKKEAIKTVQTYKVNAVITELNRIIQEDPEPNYATAATNALEEIGPAPWNSKEKTP